MDRYKTLLALLSPSLPVKYAKKFKVVAIWLHLFIEMANKYWKIINSLTNISMEALPTSPNRISTCRRFSFASALGLWETWHQLLILLTFECFWFWWHVSFLFHHICFPSNLIAFASSTVISNIWFDSSRLSYLETLFLIIYSIELVSSSQLEGCSRSYYISEEASMTLVPFRKPDHPCRNIIHQEINPSILVMSHVTKRWSTEAHVPI